MSASAARVAGRYSLTLPRDSYLPKEVRGSDPVDPQGTDIAAWTYESGGKVFAIAFQGKANKPLWHYRFRSFAEALDNIQKTIDARKSSMAAKEQRRVEKSEWVHDLVVGDILMASWGYDQTNIDYYEVTQVVGKSVMIRDLEKRVVKREVPYNYVVPAPGHYKGPAERKLAQKGSGGPYGGDYVRINSHTTARKWDGKPHGATMSEYGH